MNEVQLKNHIARREQQDPDGYVQLGEQMLEAMDEIARGLAGATFAKVLLDIAVTDFPLPSAESLEVLERLSPGSAMRVMIRAREIRENQQKIDQREARREFGSQVF